MPTPRSLVTDLVSRLELADVQIDDSGSCGLLFDQDINVTLEPDPSDPRKLHLHTQVGAVPHEEKRRFFIWLLRGNYLGHHTRGATLALDAEAHSVQLRFTLDAERTDVGQLAEQLIAFVANARVWLERLSSVPSSASSTSSTVWEGELDPLTTSFIRI